MGNKIFSDKGYSLILVPLILGIILSMVAFISDIGKVVIIKHQLQSAADSAAIAGASMIKVEFAVGSDGKFQFDNTEVSLVGDKAYLEADKLFKKNIDKLNLDSQGVKILESKGTIKDEIYFEYYVKTDVPVSLMAALLGSKGMQTITIISQAKPEE